MMRNAALKKLHLAFVVLACMACGLVRAQAGAIEPLDKFPHSQLQIATPDARVHTFSVWIAADGLHREQGLMFIKSLPDDAGMLFIYPTPQPIAMWMKNTFISLDMLFIRADGRVARVESNTKPQSLKTIESGENVLAVLELKAGAAAKRGIKTGAIVMHPVFDRAATTRTEPR
jgi:uncharacterized membrane protein (UPF0127 family)